jgi:hypothetical protein
MDICTLEDTMDRLFCEFLCVHLPWKHLPWYDGICRSLWPDAYYYLAFLKFVGNMISWVTGIFSEHIYSYILYLCTIQSVHKAGLADLILSQRANGPCGDHSGSFRINILTWNSGHVGVGWLKTTYSSQKQTVNYHPSMDYIQINSKINMFTLVYTSNFWPHQP